MKSCVQRYLLVAAAVLATCASHVAFGQGPANQAAVVGVSVSNLSVSPGGTVVMANYNGSGQLVGGKIIDNTIAATGDANGQADAETRVTNVIQPLIQQGRDGGAWDGTTGFTDPAALYDQNNITGVESTAIASAVNIDIGSYSGNYYTTQWAGKSYGTSPTSALQDNSILIAHTWVGDTDLNGSVDINDVQNFNFGYNGGTQANGLPGWVFGDFNNDGVVNINDVQLFNNGFNNGGQSTPIWGESIGGPIVASDGSVWNLSAGGGVKAVPEPGTMALFGAGALLMFARFVRRRRVG